MIHNFPELGYEYDALEPHIDAKTMEIHYSKHHKAYFDKFLKAMGIKKAEQQNKLLIKKKELPEEETRVIVLKP